MADVVATSQIPFATIASVDVDDRVQVGSTYHDWTDALTVDQTDEPVVWDVPCGEEWATRSVILQTRSGTEYFADLDSHGDSVLRFRDNETGNWVHGGLITNFEPLGDAPDPGEETWFCAGCGYGPTTQHGAKIHVGRSHEDGSNIEVLPEAPDVDLEEEAEDDASEGSSDDVQDADAEDEVAAEQISVDEADDVQDDDQDEDEIDPDLPDRVTAEDVERIVGKQIDVGDLAEELGVHRNRARWIAHDLGLYARVREVWRDRSDQRNRGKRAQLTLSGWIAFALVCLLTFGAALAIANGVIVP